MTGKMWNLWHGCHKKSEGCANCYVYRSDAKYDRDAKLIVKTKKFNLPVERKKNGEYKVPAGSIFWTCFTSDFLLEQCDEWRKEAWEMIRERVDCYFLFITKRIERFKINLPETWGNGWEHVTVCCTCENQKRVDERLPVFLEMPIKHKRIVCEPLLGKIDLSKYLNSSIEEVVAGGESGFSARPCNYEWILFLREQCVRKNITFTFKQTGTYFIKDNKQYKIERRFQHSQAREAGINFRGKHQSSLYNINS